MDDDMVTSLYVLGTAVGYCIPTFIALVRGHPNCVPIMVVNLTLGWTVLGWAGALAWSLTRRQRERES
ncbi:MAG TPA: superinfection immunity protein [Nitrospira sp.]|nr:superinfection immunity protein [Nitrospira sp.]